MTSLAAAADQVVTLEKLLAIPITEPRQALIDASDLVAAAFRADKVDVFVYDPGRDTLVALGSSMQPLSAAQKKHGLDALALGNGGRAAEVYRTGLTFVSGAVDADPEELRGIRETLRVRSSIAVALEVGGERRGVLLIASLEPDVWTDADARFAETVARWVGTVLRQAEMVKELESTARAAGRRMAAEELVTVLAHDVRNLLYPVGLAMHVLQRRAERDQRHEDIRDSARARKGLGRLSALVNDILDVARIEQGLLSLELQPVALVSFVEDVAAVLTTPQHPVIVTAREDVHALIDPARLRQCLENVVANAVKHSPTGAPVRVVVERRTTSTGDVAALVVADGGPGVTPELIPHLFDRFVTGAKTGGGLGLGLFLARQIALGHRGELMVESPLEGGARFVITVPCEIESGD